MCWSCSATGHLTTNRHILLSRFLQEHEGWKHRQVVLCGMQYGADSTTLFLSYPPCCLGAGVGRSGSMV